MDYVYINDDNIASEMVKDFDPTFPGVPITERYDLPFVMRLVKHSNPESVMGMMYDKASKTFYEIPAPTPEEPNETNVLS